MKKKILLTVIAVLVIIQFIPALPSNEAEPSTSLLTRADMPEDVSAILKKACNDCHSNSSNWPWYAHVAPLSFWIGHHVEEGREHFNLSKWDSYPADRRAHKIEEAIEEIEKGGMPLESYTSMHPDALLTPEERETLIAYFKSL